MPDPVLPVLRTQTLGSLPLLQHLFDRLRLDDLLRQTVPFDDRRYRIPPATALGVLLRNLIVGRRPLYGLSEWARPFPPDLLGLAPDQVSELNDDRVGRALDRFFDADRASFLTALVVRAVREFKVDLSQFHNDSTSITFSGQYNLATGRKIRGKQALRITHGHNKDHRPDLKQLLWILTVSADGAVPVHYRVCDGNTPDDPTHIETWETVRQLAGRADFLYVADCKLCTRANLDHIAKAGGRFITVLPRNRKEDKWFRKYIQDHELPWEEVIRRPNPHGGDRPEDVWSVAPSPQRSQEGYRVLWVWSTLMAERDGHARLAQLEKAHEAVEALNTRLRGRRSRFKDRAAVADAVERLLVTAGATRWADVSVVEDREDQFKQAGPGRPGPNTQYVKTERTRFRLVWKLREDALAYDARSDGMYPLVTNCDDLAPGDVLKKYKYQPHLEKRHEQLKTVYAVAPVLLKNEGRVEALLLLYFVALLLQALIERQLRNAMKAEKLEMLPLYFEERDCRAPTASRVLEVFDTVQRHQLVDGSTVRQRFGPDLTALHRDLLRLIGVPDHLYTRGS